MSNSAFLHNYVSTLFFFYVSLFLFSALFLYKDLYLCVDCSADWTRFFQEFNSIFINLFIHSVLPYTWLLQVTFEQLFSPKQNVFSPVSSLS